jgi:riboflavin synthase
MFTGLVEATGKIAGVEAAPKGRRLTIASALLDEEMPLGASLAVDGVCLTVVSWKRGEVALDVGPETLSRSTLGELQVGVEVNLERPLRVGDRLGGHLVAGHVDAVGRIEKAATRGDAIDLTIVADAALLRYVVEKGSIAVDGISLTVNRVDGHGFDVSIIPHTQTATTLTRKRPGARVNLEVDLIGKYVEKLVQPHAPKSLLQTLKENGYVDE